ncbi:glycosyltransferase family 4 protein [Amnibacterium kyonggiense]
MLIDARPLRPNLSGVGQYVRCLTSALLAEGLATVGLLEFDFLNRSAAFRRGLGIDREHLTSRPHTVVHRKFFNGVAAYTGLPIGSLFGFGRYDLVHETYFERIPATVGDVAGGRRQVHVSTVHDLGFLRHPELFDSRNLAASRRAFDRQVRRSTVVLTPSAFTRSELLELTDVPEHRVLVTPLASTTPAFSGLPGREPRVPAAKPAPRPFALYVGNIDPRKNLRTLLRGWLSADLGRDFDLVLVGAPLRGSAELVGELEDLANRGVRYHGYVDDAQRARLYEDATCFVYPSLYEGFGLPVLEAMQAGTPVIVSDAPALVELVADAAAIVPRTDADGFGRALRDVLSDPGVRSALAARGRARAAEYDWAATARATSVGYERALAV